jgi:hypothetical protein
MITPLEPPGECLLQFGRVEELAGRVVVIDVQHIRFAADLAVFHVALSASGGFVDRGRVPLSAGGALEAGFHGYGLKLVRTINCTRCERGGKNTQARLCEPGLLLLD